MVCYQAAEMKVYKRKLMIDWLIDCFKDWISVDLTIWLIDWLIDQIFLLSVLL